LAAGSNGTILGIGDRIWLDLGAYNAWGIVLPYNTVAHLLGPYRLRNVWVEVTAVVTNKANNAPYRGAGRAEAVFALERGLDCLARELGMDPADLRRANLSSATSCRTTLGCDIATETPWCTTAGTSRRPSTQRSRQRRPR